jgi:hypothetical protein
MTERVAHKTLSRVDDKNACCLHDEPSSPSNWKLRQHCKPILRPDPAGSHRSRGNRPVLAASGVVPRPDRAPVVYPLDMATKLSHDTYQRLVAELEDLKTRGRTEIAQQIASARDGGRITQNRAYPTALDEQLVVEARIRRLEVTLEEAASEWRDAGLTAEDAAAWRKAGVFNPKVAGELAAYGSTPEAQARITRAWLGKPKADALAPRTKGLRR